MAPPTGTLRVGRYFLALAVLLALLYSIVAFGKDHAPKLGIDLVGGTQVTFTARTLNGAAPSQTSLTEARQILAERVNGTGVTQATVVVQGNNQLVVSIPGHDATNIKALGAAAVLNFRGVVAAPVPVTCGRSAAGSAGSGGTGQTGSSATPSGSATNGATASASASASAASGAQSQRQSSSAHSGDAEAARPLAAAPSSANNTPTSSGSAAQSTPAASTPAATTTPTAASSAPASNRCRSDAMSLAARAGKFTVPLTDTAYGALSQTNQQLVSAALANYDCKSASSAPDKVDRYYIACAPGREYGTTGTLAFLLGQVIVPGTQIDTATAVAPSAGQSGGNTEWTVSLDLKGRGSAAWADYTTAHNVNNNQNAPSVVQCSSAGTGCANYVAFTLDGSVVSAPVNLQAINGLATQITGNFTADSAKDLANKLKFGALPLSFNAQNQVNVSATLGSSQLRAGLIAGGIGLVLVVIYSLIYYRALGLVTIASLLVSGALTYGSLVLLGTQIGFTLSLAGIAGFIVAVGITADSFVVFFERLKDEVHEGRSVRVAVPRAWVRARRTILSADTVSFLAAAVLYYFTTDEVRGFAFTLGLSTILDLIVVFLFTHPLVSLLSRSRAFGSAKFTGLDALRGSARVEPAERARATATRGPRRAQRGGGVAVLDKTDTDLTTDSETDLDTDLAAQSDLDTDLDAETEVEDAEPASSVEPDEGDEPESAPRRRTTPQSGSAAERAAARRARLRAERGDDEGKR